MSSVADRKSTAKSARSTSTRPGARGAARPVSADSKAKAATAKPKAKARVAPQVASKAKATARPQSNPKPEAASASNATAGPQSWLAALMAMMPPAAQAGVPHPLIKELPAMPDVRIDPTVLLGLQSEYQQKLGELWQAFLAGGAEPRLVDKRFSGAAWHGMHAYVAAVYELNAEFMNHLAERVEADSKTQAKIKFAVQQWVDAMSPANYLATNPEAQNKLIETRGESLQAGLSNLLTDLQKGRISQTDESAFEVGVNVANSVGAVVFQNEIFQLIQYKPTTATVHERPLLMVPPCINKYYILDLQPDNSVVRHVVASGHTVFMVSWCNPTEAQAGLTWDDYMEEGVIRAIRVVQEISRHERINMLGFCVGGTMLATALAVLAARGEQPAESITLLTTLLDFSDTGSLEVFVDENQVKQREQTIGGMGGNGTVGLMPARDLATSFSFLRPNDLVWNYVVSNYLKGEAPPAFDLLYWNADSTNLPGPFFAWYLRNTYLENKLREAGRLRVCGESVDLGSITAPVFIYGSREDHIVPWHAAYSSTQVLKGPKRFVLGASGHIAGVINPPAKKKRNYWLYEPLRGRFPVDPEVWFKAASEHPGSWWPEWMNWLATHGGRQVGVPAKAGDSTYRVIEPAPGNYAKVRA